MTKSEVVEVDKIIKEVLACIEKEREREIISRRYGLFDRKETLEQIGELLGITRERVRQLEKSIITRLISQAKQGSIPYINDLEIAIADSLAQNGDIQRITVISKDLFKDDSKINQSRITFLATLAPNLIAIDENDNYYQSVTTTKAYQSGKLATDKVDAVVKTIENIGKPTPVKDIVKALSGSDVPQLNALAQISKQLSCLNNNWGLSKWPTVNPKNIRDKIYVILKENGKQMHFSEIADKIKQSDFKRKNVTTQAIHNELIKDSRFILVGRGIYALKEWGFKKGTVSDVIVDILKKANQPLHRDEIIKQVLKNRYVKETTILLNLQGKKKFKRVAKATYDLAEAE